MGKTGERLCPAEYTPKIYPHGCFTSLFVEKMTRMEARKTVEVPPAFAGMQVNYLGPSDMICTIIYTYIAIRQTNKKVNGIMKGNPFKYIIMAAISAILLIMPSVIPAEVEQLSTGPPPVEQQLIREGELAIKLVFALGLGVSDDEAEAESRLAEYGIVPRSGWIADYPVTPDISGELRNAVSDAADAGRLSMGRAEAMRVFDDVLAGLGLPLAPYTGTAYDSPPPTSETYYQDPDVINDYYDTIGPPVVTYYTPPPSYYYLYAWVPYPFWATGFLFPGFFVLHDFHRTVYVHHRKAFVTNHFRDARTHRIHRVDPVARFRGDSFVGRRGHGSRAFSSDRVWSSDRRFSDGQRTRTFRDGSNFRQRSDDTRALSLPSGGNDRDIRQSFDRTRSFTTSSQNVRNFNRSSGVAGRGDGQRFDRTRSFTTSSQNARSFNRSSVVSGRDNRQSFDRTRSLTPSSQNVRSFNRSSGISGRGERQSFDRARSFTPSSQNVRSFNRPSGSSGRDTRQSFDRARSFTPSSQGARSFGRPSSWSGSTNMRSGGARSFSSVGRGGGNSHGGRGRR